MSNQPELECDLVLKGGITSGLVYPPAIAKLSSMYRFRGIGGTSAGAIAAAAAAAAEYSRQGGRTGENTGFKGLERMQRELSAPQKLFELFTPRAEVRHVWEAVWSLVGGWSSVRGRWLQSTWSLVVVAWRSSRERFLLGALSSMVASLLVLGAPLWLILCDPRLPDTWRQIAAVAVIIALSGVFALIAGVVAGLWAIVVVLRGLPSSSFGICTGLQPVPNQKRYGAAAVGPLTDWLYSWLQRLAGKDMDQPLLLSELRERGIDFKAVTTDLSLCQPFILPLVRGAKSFVFRESELATVFPEAVVGRMMAWSAANPSTHFALPTGFHRFPMGPDMPLIVAVRMSLSFPLLLQAVRIQAVTSQAYKRLEQAKTSTGTTPDVVATDLEDHWFSDGGIASNFPIHIFDEWVPGRPTFGITLTTETNPDADSREDVLLPLPKDFALARPRYTPITGLFDFLYAIFDTAQNFRDNAQACLPSYRERIVQVGLRAGEGGLNLQMTPDVIEKMEIKGARAADLLIEHFCKGKETSYEEHVWVRLYVLMAELEREFERTGTQATAMENGGWRREQCARIRALLDKQLKAKGEGHSWYRPLDVFESEQAQLRFEQLLELAERWRGAGPLFSRNPPSPRGMLRLTGDV